MSWFLLNTPFAAACFAAWVGIPLYMVLKHPHWGPEHPDRRVSPLAEARPALVPEREEALVGATMSPDSSGYYQ